MNTTLRVVLAVLAAAIGIGVILVGLCWVVSNAGVGVSFVTLRNLKIGGFTTPRFPTFKIGEMLSWLTVPANFQKAYMKGPYQLLAPFVLGAVVWLILQYVVARVLRAFANKKTTLHGSAKWATEEELEKMGMLGQTGVVLGQTYEAKYVEKDKKPPRRKDFKTKADYEAKMINWAPGVDTVLEKKGELILQKSNAHMLIVGSTRSGKGVSCIIPTEFKWPESIIIFDPKAEGWDISSNFRSKFSYTFKFQPEKPEESIHYNPLLSIRRGTSTMPDIQNLCLSLIALNEQSKDPFWDNEARKLLAAVIGYVIYCMPPDRKTFREVYSIFTAQDDDFKANAEADSDENADESPVQKRLRFYAEQTTRYLEMAKESLMMSPELKDRFMTRFESKVSEKERKEIEKAAEGRLMEEDIHNIDRIRQDLEYFAGCESRQLSSVVSTMMSNLQVIADPNVQEVTSRSDFTMEDFVDGVADDTGKKRPVSLYLCMSLASMQRLIPIMKIFYEQAITLLTRCTPEECKRRPYRLLLIFDEFRQMGKMDIVEKALALSAGYGVLCMIAVQSYDQLKTLYQSDALFTDNFAYQVILRVNDPSTCKKVEEMLGQATMKHTKLNSSGNLGNIVHKHESLDTSEVGRSLMTAEEVRTLPEQDCLVIMSGTHPYRAKKIRYYLDDRFKKLYLSDNGKGKMLPVPALDDNYPHPDTFEMVDSTDKDGNPVKKRIIHGLDREGWGLLLGIKTDVGSLASGEVKPAENKAANDDFLNDTTVDPKETVSEKKAEAENDISVADLDDMTKAIEEYFNSIGEEDENEEGESTAGLKAATAILP